MERTDNCRMSRCVQERDLMPAINPFTPRGNVHCMKWVFGGKTMHNIHILGTLNTTFSAVQHA
jgi:hypothetical protein